MRRSDRAKSKNFALAVADKCAYSILATVNQDDTPYCIPLSFARQGEYLYFHSAPEGHKLDNLRYKNQVCITCVGEQKSIPGEFSLQYESAVIFGTASEITDREEKIHALRLISERYAPEDMAGFAKAIERGLDRTTAWKVHIDEISGKARES